jgi:hypothetical protein
VIDLEAEDVAEARDSPDPPPHAPPQPQRKSAVRYWPQAALAALALLAGAWLYKNYGQGIWPSDAITAMSARIGTLEAESRTLTHQLSGLGATVDQAKTETASLAQTIEALRSSGETAMSTGATAKETADALKAQLAATEQRLAMVQKTIDALKPAPAGTPTTAPPSIDTTALASLSARVDALEKDLAGLKAKGPSPGAESATLLSQLMADLSAKLAAGAPYQSELDRIKALVPAAPGLESLSASAAAGLATAAMLAEDAKTLSASLPAPASHNAEAANQGYWDAFFSMLSSVVKVRRLDQTDWRDVAVAAAAFASQGDLEQAIRRIEDSEGELPAALARWRDKAKARLAAEAALEQVQAAVLRQISALGGAP